MIQPAVSSRERCFSTATVCRIVAYSCVTPRYVFFIFRFPFPTLGSLEGSRKGATLNENKHFSQRNKKNSFGRLLTTLCVCVCVMNVLSCSSYCLAVFLAQCSVALRLRSRTRTTGPTLAVNLITNYVVSRMKYTRHANRSSTQCFSVG